MDKIYIVMDYVEHDLKALMETMKQPFLEGVHMRSLLQNFCTYVIVDKCISLSLLCRRSEDTDNPAVTSC